MNKSKLSTVIFPPRVALHWWLVSVFPILTLLGPRALSQNNDPDRPPQGDEESSASLPNLKFPTLGGMQFWTDHCWRKGWRIQENAVTGHWRLLDARNIRHAWGSQAACYKELEKAVPADTTRAGHIVFLLHGLGRSAKSMVGLGKMLTKEAGYDVAYFEYASTRAALGDHANALTEVIEELPPGTTVSFIGHSMGNIVLRHAIGDWQRDRKENQLSKVEKVVMLGPPNQGASIARLLAKTKIFGLVTGEGGMQLGPNWKSVETQLATPHCPFGIIAGKLPEQVPSNPLVDGKGDFVVSVEETKLDGSADFLEVPRLHSFLMDDVDVQKAVATFLRHGKFR